MSLDPCPPGLVEPKVSRLPSLESDALVSAEAEFTFGPRFTGGDQAWSMLGLVADQMSGPPRPPGRSESKTISSPSSLTLGRNVLKPGAFNSVTSTGAPNEPSGWRALTYTLCVPSRLLEKNSIPPLADKYDGENSSPALFTPHSR